MACACAMHDHVSRQRQIETSSAPKIVRIYICSVLEAASFVNLQSATSLVKEQLFTRSAIASSCFTNTEVYCSLRMPSLKLLWPMPCQLAAVAVKPWGETVGRCPLYGPTQLHCSRSVQPVTLTLKVARGPVSQYPHTEL